MVQGNFGHWLWYAEMRYKGWRKHDSGKNSHEQKLHHWKECLYFLNFLTFKAIIHADSVVHRIPEAGEFWRWDRSVYDTNIQVCFYAIFLVIYCSVKSFQPIISDRKVLPSKCGSLNTISLFCRRHDEWQIIPQNIAEAECIRHVTQVSNCLFHL